jgi:hypothetical protein
VPDFTVIEGGGRGPDDPLDIDARHHLRRLVIEILRSLARGNDPEARIARELVEFSKTASRMSTPLHQIVDQLLAELSAELEPEGRDHIIELSYIVSSALGLAAETFCEDGFAKARRSDRTAGLRAMIDEHIVGRERRSREGGWSYLGKLLHDRFPPQPRMTRTRKEKAERERAERSRAGYEQAMGLLTKPKRKPKEPEK